MTAELKPKALSLLRLALANPKAEFRDGQWDAIEQLVRDRARLLVVQRTGWGKSVVYFLATRLLRDEGAGPTLLISPLLSLMRNQLLAARRLNLRAETINSSNREDWASVIAGVRAGVVDVLLISPERLSNETFRNEVLQPLASRIGMFVVDEAHSISDWGHDFRPDYLRVTSILQLLPRNIPLLATTATANTRVVDDVVAQLGRGLMVSRGPLVRESLQLQVIPLPQQAQRMAWLAEHIPSIPGSGIIYALTVADAQRLAEWLQDEGIDAHAYWGGLEDAQRRSLEDRLLANRVKALVATTALGMGFDKPDLGFVVHYQRPGSAVHYYQQVGRAGRAVERAYGVLLCGAEDQDITDYFIKTAFPPEAHTAEVLAALRDAEEGLSVPALEHEVNLTRGQIEKVLKLLSVKSPAPVTKEGSRWYRAPVRYSPDTEKVEWLTRLRRHEQERMLAYMEGRECLMQFLGRELDDPAPAPSGRCSVCRGGPILPETYSPALLMRALPFLRRSDRPIQPRLQWSYNVIMRKDGGTIPPELRVEKGRALCVWGDDGWGELVRRGKRAAGCEYDDELVEAVVELVQDRWRPSPFPEWVTCVPSLSHPRLVPDLARRVAFALNLPFRECVNKV